MHFSGEGSPRVANRIKHMDNDEVYGRESGMCSKIDGETNDNTLKANRIKKFSGWDLYIGDGEIKKVK